MGKEVGRHLKFKTKIFLFSLTPEGEVEEVELRLVENSF